MSKNRIIIRNLNKFYGKKHALCDIDLTINQGMFGLLGRNGAGKTTLMKTLATLLPKKYGDISICGIPIENAKEIRKIVGYLPQDFSMYPSMTVYQAMDYLGTLSELSKTERKDKIPFLLKEVNLAENRDTKVKALSGGMKRRLGIAQALLHNPKVLIVDEPTAGLDPEERIRFRNLLCEIAEDRIVILSTHIVGDIEATCENVAVLNEGRILYFGNADELAAQANGKVYSLKAPKSAIDDIKIRYTVLSVQTTGEETEFRVLADTKPNNTVVLCKPTIEDGYMQLFKNHKEVQ